MPQEDHRNSGCGQQRACFSLLGSNSCFLILWGLSPVFVSFAPSQSPLAEVAVGRQFKIKIQPGLQRIGARGDLREEVFPDSTKALESVAWDWFPASSFLPPVVVKQAHVSLWEAHTKGWRKLSYRMERKQVWGFIKAGEVLSDQRIRWARRLVVSKSEAAGFMIKSCLVRIVRCNRYPNQTGFWKPTAKEVEIPRVELAK